MRFLIIGGGSMGRRRVRCLKSLGYTDILVYDENPDVAMAVYAEYGVSVCYKIRTVKDWCIDPGFDACMVCVPPMVKQPYIDLANRHDIPVFAEADIISYKGEYYPSRTMVYHPAIKKIKEMLEDDDLGDIYTFNYRLGQHIKDWHPGADYSKYYAAKKRTSGAFEMVVFEVAWLSWILGIPIDVKGMIAKQLDIPEIKADDVCSFSISFNGTLAPIPSSAIVGTILIDTVSLPAARELIIIGEKGTLVWDWTKETITTFWANKAVSEILIRAGEAAEGYHPSICEQMYVDEIAEFIYDVTHKANFTSYGYTPEDEAEVIKILDKLREDNK